MTVYPIVYTTVGYIVAQFHGECAVDWTSFELISHQCKRRHVVSCDNHVPSLTFSYTPLNEFTTRIMFLIETLSRKSELSVAYSMEIGYTSLSLEFLMGRNFCPKSRCYKLYILRYGNNTVIDRLYIWANVEFPPFMKLVDVETLVEFVITGNDYCLPEVLGTPIPERMPFVVFISEITDVTGKNEYVANGQ